MTRNDQKQITRYMLSVHIFWWHRRGRETAIQPMDRGSAAGSSSNNISENQALFTEKSSWKLLPSSKSLPRVYQNHPFLARQTFYSPVKERLSWFGFAPFFIVQVQAMPVAVPGINLQSRRRYVHVEYQDTNYISIFKLPGRILRDANFKQGNGEGKLITASIQCWKANFCALASLDKPFPTCPRKSKTQST